MPPRLSSPRVALAAALVALVLTAPAHADTVSMRSGTTYEGEIVSVDDTSVVIETDSVGRISIPRRSVASYQRTGDTAPTSVDNEADAPAKSTSTDTPKNGAGQGDAGKSGSEATGDTPAADEKTAQEAAEEEARRRREELEALSAKKRVERMKRARIKRRTKPKKADDGADDDDAEDEPTGDETATTGTPTAPGTTDPEAGGEGATTQPEAPERTIGGDALATVPQGRHVIVFEPPQKIGETGAGIALGRRTFAEMGVAGVAVARVVVSYLDGPQTMSVRLTEVKRHIVVEAPSDRRRMLEGVSRSDWVRVSLADGTKASGRLQDYADGRLTLREVHDDGRVEQRVVPEGGIVQLDGLLRNTTTVRELTDLVTDEPIALTLWPEQTQIVGRFIRTDGGMLRIDRDDDGQVDRSISLEAPIVDVQRVPLAWRGKSLEARRGRWVAVAVAEQFEDARVERTYRSQVVSVTAYTLSLAAGDGAIVVPYKDLAKLESLDAQEIATLAGGTAHLGESGYACDVPVLPGAPSTDAGKLQVERGLSAITNGRKVTHVFITAPFEGEIYGIVLGEPVRTAQRTTDLRFDTVVVPTLVAGEFRPREFVSESLNAHRVTMLVDAAGRVMGVELARYD